MNPYIYLVNNPGLGVVKAGKSASANRGRLLTWLAEGWEPILLLDLPDPHVAHYAEMAVFLHWYKQGLTVGADAIPNGAAVRAVMKSGYTEVVAATPEEATDGVVAVLEDLTGRAHLIPMSLVLAPCRVDGWTRVWEVESTLASREIGSIDRGFQVHTTALHDHEVLLSHNARRSARWGQWGPMS